MSASARAQKPRSSGKSHPAAEAAGRLGPGSVMSWLLRAVGSAGEKRMSRGDAPLPRTVGGYVKP
jgi:hypothetical protein